MARERRSPELSAVRHRATIESLDHEGRGVAHLEGKAIFIRGALPLEQVVFSIVRDRKSYALGQTEAVLRASSARTEPACVHFGVCGGCSLQHIEMHTQVAAKQRHLEDAFWHIAGVRPQTLLAPIYGPAWGYRHRARLSVRLVPKKGGVLVGFHERGSSYVADMRSCEVLPRAVSDLLIPLRELVGSLSIVQRLPQIEVAVGSQLTVLVLRVLEPPSAADEALLRAFAERHAVQIWLQPRGPETAQPFHPLDAPALDYRLPDFGLSIGFLPTDFTQVNHAINQVLVRRALRLLAPAPGERIGDFFCGLGNFTLPIAASGADVTGYEGHAGLVKRAEANAARAGLRARFEVANLFEPDRVPDLAGFDKLLIDPPRDGAVELVKRIPAEGGPRRIVYVSCDPATLARDAAVLVHTRGFALRAAGIANMFPHTTHVESIALFEKDPAGAAGLPAVAPASDSGPGG
jgi:23S rRNA (uracil1939-C5)-methyltransferase